MWWMVLPRLSFFAEVEHHRYPLWAEGWQVSHDIIIEAILQLGTTGAERYVLLNLNTKERKMDRRDRWLTEPRGVYSLPPPHAWSNVSNGFGLVSPTQRGVF